MKLVLFTLLALNLGGCTNFSSNEVSYEPSSFIRSMKAANLKCVVLKDDSDPQLMNSIPGHDPFGIYQGDDFKFVLFDLPGGVNLADLDDQNESITFFKNQNLMLLGIGQNARPYIAILEKLKQPLSVTQLGLFIYPLGICLLMAVFISFERIYSLRSGLTFPRKVAKALNNGEFPDRKWKKHSAAERIVWVATRENPSIDSLRSYSRLEIASMERGLFLLEVVVSAAPLLGLLGTVTGLVQVFSQIPSGGGAGDPSIFSEGIAMALLTTIVGLAIAIPTLIAHAYLVRLIEKRASSLDWLTEKLVDAVYPKNESI